LEYGEDEDISEIAHLLVKKDQIESAGMGNMETFCKNPSKFTFPYSENIIVIEVASEKSHQSVKKYCEQDVKVTKDIFDYARKHGHVKFKDGHRKKEIPLDIAHWEEKEDAAMTHSMLF